MKLPAGTTTISGQSAQSWKVSPASGAGFSAQPAAANIPATASTIPSAPTNFIPAACGQNEKFWRQKPSTITLPLSQKWEFQAKSGLLENR